MPVLLHGISQCLPPCGRAGEDLQFAAAVAVEPLDAPLVGVSRSSKTLAGSGHRGLHVTLTRPALLPRRHCAGRSGGFRWRIWLWPRDGWCQFGRDGRTAINSRAKILQPPWLALTSLSYQAGARQRTAFDPDTRRNDSRDFHTHYRRTPLAWLRLR